MTIPTDPAMVATGQEAPAQPAGVGAPGAPESPDGAVHEHVSRGRLVLRRFLRRKLSLVGLAVLVALFVLAFAGPYLSQWDYDQKDFTALHEPPSLRHYFGTTLIGEDLYAQTLRGLQKSLVIGLLVAFFSTGIAAVAGASAGYYGGWVDRVLMWIVDLLLVLPAFLIIAILSPQFRGKTWLLFVVLLAAFSWMITARIVRGLTLSLREREFVQAARFMGVPSAVIIFRHLLPSMSSFLIIDATLNVGGAVLAETGLSFFGFGVQPPDVSLGTMIERGYEAALTFPWEFLPAGILLILTVLSVSVVGDGLRDALDPHSTSVRAHEPV